jgi:hypothetical protein
VLEVGAVLREYLAGLFVEVVLDHELLGDDAGDTLDHLGSSSNVTWPAVTRVFTIFVETNWISSGERRLAFSRREL